MQLSHFNVWIPLKDGAALLHNALSLRSLHLTRENACLVWSWIRLGRDPGNIPLILRLQLRSIQAVCESADQQLDLLRQKDSDSKRSTENVMITIMLTEACNFSCQYCNQGLEKGGGRVTADLIQNIIDHIESLRPAPRNVEITWYGGEPLLQSAQLISSSLSLRRECENLSINYRSVVVSNGFLLAGDLPRRLFDAGVSGVQVTLDGDRSRHDSSRYVRQGFGTYDRIVSNISNALEFSDLVISVRVNVDRRNADSLLALIDDLDARGLLLHPRFSLYWANVYDPALSMLAPGEGFPGYLLPSPEFAVLQHRLNGILRARGMNVASSMPQSRGSCVASQFHSFAVRPDGTLFKCYIPIANDDESCGHLSDISAAQNSANYARWDGWSPFDQPECGGCRLLASCRGACRIHFLSEHYRPGHGNCPPAKFSLHEDLFDEAVASGLVKESDWDPLLSPTNLDGLRFKRWDTNVMAKPQDPTLADQST